MRRGVSAALPWVALLAVTVFALAQVRARRDGERPEAPVAALGVPPAASPASAPSETPGTDDPARALRLARAGFADERRNLETALAEARSLREQAEAVRSTAEARAAALAAEAQEARGAAEALRERMVALEREVAALRQQVASARDPVEELLAAAKATPSEPARSDLQARAAALATEALTRLRDQARAEASLSSVIVRLLPSLAEGEIPSQIATDLLLSSGAEAEAATRLEAAARHLRTAEDWSRVLAGAGPAVLREALARAAARSWSDEERARLAEALATRLERAAPAVVAEAARGLGLLRVGGFAPRLAPLLRHPAEAVRETAAYALSRVPDLATVRTAAVEAAPALLDDGSLRIRVAALLLAEALLGESLAFDPAAPQGARREALAKILPRLKP